MTQPDQTGRLVPPWDEATVNALNGFQHAGRMHPFTCRRDSSHVLVATPDGWRCGHDDYTQPWAHSFMADPSEFFPPVPWHEIEPVNAVHLLLPNPWITGPVNEIGEPCPWPWEPQQLVGVPMGQYHCPHCGAMCVAGVPHPDYRDDLDTPAHGVIQQ